MLTIQWSRKELIDFKGDLNLQGEEKVRNISLFVPSSVYKKGSGPRHSPFFPMKETESNGIRKSVVLKK